VPGDITLTSVPCGWIELPGVRFHFLASTLSRDSQMKATQPAFQPYFRRVPPKWQKLPAEKKTGAWDAGEVGTIGIWLSPIGRLKPGATARYTLALYFVQWIEVHLHVESARPHE
jgi:hypothetical protein